MIRSIIAIIIIAIAVIKIYRFSNSKIIKHKIKCHSILPKTCIVKTTYTLLGQKGSIRHMLQIPRRICRLLSRVLHSMNQLQLHVRKFAKMGLKWSILAILKTVLNYQMRKRLQNRFPMRKCTILNRMINIMPIRLRIIRIRINRIKLIISISSN
jgi:hypothetical protein